MCVCMCVCMYCKMVGMYVCMYIHIGVGSPGICTRFFPHWVKALAPEDIDCLTHCRRRETRARAGEGARDTESKTRTPHKDVGKKLHAIVMSALHSVAPGALGTCLS